MCCHSCKYSLSHDEVPQFAIAKSYLLGTPPNILLQLTDIELAMLTPVKVMGNFGYCFGYTGGAKNSLKGSLTYLKVDMSKIIRSIAHFDVLGLHDTIVILLYGNMMPAQ